METALLKKSLKTDRKTQTAVYNAHYPLVYSSCLRILNDVHEAEDLMQEAFIQAFKSIDRFRGDAKLSTWICRIAINKCLDHLKKRRIKLDFDDKWEQRSDHLHVGEADGEKYDIERINRAIQDLPEGCRIIFSLYIFEDMDHDTIAGQLGIKAASSRAQYARAKNKIKELLTTTYV